MTASEHQLRQLGQKVFFLGIANSSVTTLWTNSLLPPNDPGFKVFHGTKNSFHERRNCRENVSNRRDSSKRATFVTSVVRQLFPPGSFARKWDVSNVCPWEEFVG